jgi:hypothetical protein
MLKELLLLTAMGLALGACTSGPRPSAREADVNSQAKVNTANCAGSASRLPGPANCRYPGTSYSTEELQQTGQTEPGAALKMLDPRITGH